MTTGEVTSPATRHRGAFFGVATFVVVIDQITKHWALNALADGPIDIVGTLRFKLTFNDGAAFSLGSGRTQIISVIALVVVAFIIRMGWRAQRSLWAVGLGVVCGGAVGNLVDRALRSGDGILGGHVVDFIDLQRWPVFNLADSALWVGIGLLAIASRREPEES